MLEEMGSCDVPRKYFQGHMGRLSLSVVTRFIGMKRNNAPSGR